MENQVNAMYLAQNGTFNDIGCIQTTATLLPNTVSGGLANANNMLCLTPWDYWQNFYYPQVIRESYPVYIKKRAEDKGKQAFEIIKMLQDKGLVKFEKVSDFIDAMDALIKVL